MIQPIYLYGSEVLRRKAAEADLAKKDELNALVQDLRDTLTRADGCGLAAPQIGVSLRVVIVDGDVVADTYEYLKGFKRVIINPEILEESDEKVTYSEGCLSIPNIYCDVLRPAKMTLRYYNENGASSVIHGEKQLDHWANSMEWNIRGCESQIIFKGIK